MKKTTNDPKTTKAEPKRRYETPKMTPLEAMGNVKLAAAVCTAGSGDATSCSNGNNASNTCTTGSGVV